MEKIKKHISTIIILTLIISAFYWYEYRPNLIRKECASYARESAVKITEVEIKSWPIHLPQRSSNIVDFLVDRADVFYEWCLRKNGIERN